ncbi:hypothetical protein DFH09DRAFT_1375501 [Mycena vulgaris]|nr:hypothetical protein DFH09DRAFT_1375501 [Mycena vulgaris]
MDPSFRLRPFRDDLAIRLLMESPSSASLRRVLQGEELFYLPPPHRTRTLPPTSPLPHTGRRTHPATKRLLFLNADHEDSDALELILAETELASAPRVRTRSPSDGMTPLWRPQAAHLDLLPSPPIARRLRPSSTTPLHFPSASAEPSSSSPHARTALPPLSLNVRRRYLRAHPHPQRDERERERSRTGGWVGRRTRRVEAEERGWGVEAGALVHRLRLRF